MLKSIFALAVAVLLAVPAQAQLSFATTTHDFGGITEGAAATHTFIFTNDGAVPLKLRSVRPSCGCTAPTFTTDAVAPGETGEIVIVYDSQGRPGPFRKSIQVTAEAGNAAVDETLYIVGDVARETISAAAGAPQGNVVFDTDAFDLGTVTSDQSVTHVFKMQHAGTKPIRITEAKSYPDGLRIVYPTTPVFADDLVSIRVTVPPGTSGDLDYAVVLTTDDDAQPTKSLRLTGTAGVSQ
jgi:hypothetical protein